MSIKRAFYFKFYPGEYLRDTQNLSVPTQVAYDRIMCEHMRNICISYAQHTFFTKRLNEDEKTELLMVLRDTGAGFEIPWVVESILKSQAYSESRANSRRGKTKETYEKHMKSYDDHMESKSKSNSKNSIEENKEGLREEKEKPKKTVAAPIENDMTFPSDAWREVWDAWAAYKLKQHKERYKMARTAQIALNDLMLLSNHDPATGWIIINHTMARLWKGFVKPNANGTQQSTIFPAAPHAGAGTGTKLGTSDAKIDTLKRW